MDRLTHQSVPGPVINWSWIRIAALVLFPDDNFAVFASLHIPSINTSTDCIGVRIEAIWIIVALEYLVEAILRKLVRALLRSCSMQRS